MKSKKILVIGCSGFIGQNLVEHFEKYSDHKIYGVDRYPPAFVHPSEGFALLDLAGSEIKHDLLSENFDIIINLASETKLEMRLAKEYQKNLKILQNVMSALVVPSGARFIHFSSMLADQDLWDRFDRESLNVLYGKSKQDCERYLTEKHADIIDRITIVRPTSIWGKYFGSPYIDFFKSIENRRYLSLTRTSYKSFGFVGTVSRQICWLVANTKSDLIYIVGDAEPYELKVFANHIADRLMVKRPLIVPPFFLVFVATVMGWIFGQSSRNLLPKTRLKNLLQPICYNPINLNYCPLKSFESDCLESHVAEVCEWYKTNV